MRHEKIFTRPDGTRYKVIAGFHSSYIGNDFKWDVEVLKCGPRKRTWFSVSTNDYEWRSKTMEERARINMERFLQVVTKDEILATKIELWEQLKPTI